MTDPLIQQLTRELGRRASELSEAPDLIADVVRRGHAVRRRRTVGAALAAGLVVVAVVIVGIALPDLHTPSAKQPVSPPTRTNPTNDPLEGPLTIPYAVNGARAPDGSWTRTTIRLPAADGGRAVTLPERWLVDRVNRAGAGVVADVRVALTAGPTRFAVYVSPAGTVRVLRNLDVGAIPLDPDGLQWVSAVPGAPVDPNTDSRTGLSVVQPDSDTVAASQSTAPADRMVAVLADRAIVVQNSVAELQLWSLDGKGSPGRTIDVRGTPWFWSDIAADGRILVRAPGALHLLDPAGAELWSWDKPTGLRWSGLKPAFFSPDGSRIVVGFQTGFAVLSADSGSVITDPDLGSGLVLLGWESDDTVIATDRSSGEPGRGVERCSVSTRRCSPLALPNDIIIAEN